MLDRNPGAVAVMAAVLLAFGWYTVDLALPSKLVTLALSLAAFLLAVAAFDRLRARYGPTLPEES